MFPPHFGHLPNDGLPVKSIFGGGSLERSGNFRTRGANSKLTLPSFTTRNASNLRPVLFETKPLSKSVLPSLNNFATCALSIGCCKMIAPVLKSHVLFGPVAFSQM